MARRRIDAFNFKSGTVIAKKYRIKDRLGMGWEGEVYKVREIRTGIDRAAKFIFPQRNRESRTFRRFVKRYHKLRDCKILIHYRTEEQIDFEDIPITVLISDYFEGLLLTEFLMYLPGKRLGPFEGAHLIYTLACGLEEIHKKKEYHGDLHSENIMVGRHGITFDLKILDLYEQTGSNSENRKDDICDLIRLFYDILGGQKRYSKQPDAIKYIICGLKRSHILSKFKTMTALRKHLETMEWW